MLVAQIQLRGCKEDFQPDAALMKDGQVQFSQTDVIQGPHMTKLISRVATILCRQFQKDTGVSAGRQ